MASPSSSSATRRRVLQASLTLLAAPALFGRAASAADMCERATLTDSGPFYPVAEFPAVADLTRGPEGSGRARGRILHLHGTVQDHRCAPLPGVAVEIWQTDDDGQYRHPRATVGAGSLDPNFRYFARVRTDANGAYAFTTVAPRPYTLLGILRAPHIHFRIKHPEFGELTTEMYFDNADDARIRTDDAIFQSRPRLFRDKLIVAKRDPELADRAALGLDGFEPGAKVCRFDLAFL